MSTGERDPLDIEINGEFASDDQLELLEGLGHSLLESAPLGKVRQCGYLVEETKAGINFCHWQDQNDPSDQSVTLSLYRHDQDDTVLCLYFGDDSVPYFNPLEEGEHQEATSICRDLLATSSLDPEAEFIVKSIESLIGYLDRSTSGAETSNEGRIKVQDRLKICHGLAYDVIEAGCEGTIYVREYGFRWEDGVEIIVNGRELIPDDPDIEVYDPEFSRFDVTVDTDDLEYTYKLDLLGNRSLSVLGNNQDEFDVELDETDDEEVLAFRKELGLDLEPIPNVMDVQFLIKKLVTAQMQDPTVHPQA